MKELTMVEGDDSNRTVAGLKPLENHDGRRYGHSNRTVAGLKRPLLQGACLGFDSNRTVAGLKRVHILRTLFDFVIQIAPLRD